jgi:hypothetical protein
MLIKKKWFKLFVALIVLMALAAGCAPAAPATRDDCEQNTIIRGHKCFLHCD